MLAANDDPRLKNLHTFSSWYALPVLSQQWYVEVKEYFPFLYIYILICEDT